MSGEELHIGVDDVDSPYGMCTTYIGAALAAEFARRGNAFIDFPHLVRLNPNIPFKTRGNGAVSIHIKLTNTSLEEAASLVEGCLEKFSERHGKADPTAVLVTAQVEELRPVYKWTLREFVPPSYVIKVLKSLGALVIGGRKGRGVVGAAASVGALGCSPYTYELMVYRSPHVRVRDRGVEEAVIEVDRMLRPLLFANMDYRERRVIAVPHGPDPVIVGMRSTNPLILASLAPRLVSRWQAVMAIIYKSNQATGQHLETMKTTDCLRPYSSVTVRGYVNSPPVTMKGGHVTFALTDSRSSIACVVYRETGFLTRVARLLREGDEVEVGGGVQPRNKGLTLNVECIRVLKLATGRERPLLSSCGYRDGQRRGKLRGGRILEPGLYVQSASAYRHLSPPPTILGVRPVPAPPMPRLFIHPYPPPPLLESCCEACKEA